MIHAKHLRERMVHMERQLRDWPGEVVYVTEADKDELTDELIDSYFVPGCELYNKSGATSCAIKHLRACQYIVDHQLEGALVLEDDIVNIGHTMPNNPLSSRMRTPRCSSSPDHAGERVCGCMRRPMAVYVSTGPCISIRRQRKPLLMM